MATVPYSLTVNGNLLKTSMTGTDLATSQLKCRTPYMYFAGAGAGAGAGACAGAGTAVQVQPYRYRYRYRQRLSNRFLLYIGTYRSEVAWLEKIAIHTWKRSWDLKKMLRNPRNTRVERPDSRLPPRYRYFPSGASREAPSQEQLLLVLGPQDPLLIVGTNESWLFHLPYRTLEGVWKEYDTDPDPVP